MPSSFDQEFSRVAEPGLQKHFGFAISYSDSAGNQQLDARVTREVQKRRPNHVGGWDLVTTRTARFPTPETVIRVDGTVTIEGKEYSIESIQAIEGERTELNLLRVDVGELSRPGFRR